jgi:hypothetical protein
LAFVFMGREDTAGVFFDRYGLGDVPRFSDVDYTLYRAFGLRRLPVLRFFGGKVVRRAVEAFRQGHRIGRVVGDALRMPGVFLLHKGRVLRAYRHESLGDQPDYGALAVCPLPDSEMPA